MKLAHRITACEPTRPAATAGSPSSLLRNALLAFVRQFDASAARAAYLKSP